MLIAAASFTHVRDTAAAIAAALAAGSILLGLWNYRAAVSQTTLVSAAGWAAVATVAIAGVEFWRVAFPQVGPWLSPVRFCVAVLSFCPFVSLLGAKRPQHLAWNFVVMSLWGIVSLSALTALALQRSDRFVLGDARAWLLWVLILMGLINYLPTRNRFAALGMALGQGLLFTPHLPLLRDNPWLANLAAGPSLALLVFAIALAVARPGMKVSNQQTKPATAEAFDRLWLDFRDLFGMLWGLRLQERVNAASKAGEWKVELEWNGFSSQGISPKHREALRQAMAGLLRRFVSHEWIAARLEKDVD